MDFPKFISLLDTQSLFFTTIFNFPDKSEGTLPKASLDAFKTIFFSNRDTAIDRKKIIEYSREIQKYSAVNCWHINGYESSAMWSVYADYNAGIAIQSSFQRLCNSFNNCPNDIRIGKIRYIDHNKDAVSDKELLNGFSPMLLRKKEFEYEHELRAIAVYTPKKVVESNAIENGTYLPVLLDTLIESIVVSPLAHPWYLKLVKDVTQRYGLKKQVNPSRLYANPLLQID